MAQIDFRRFFHPKIHTPLLFFTTHYIWSVILRRKGSILFLFMVSLRMGVDSVAPMDYPNDGFFVHSAIPPYVFCTARNDRLAAIWQTSFCCVMSLLV
jgi:hypothetical protein